MIKLIPFERYWDDRGYLVSVHKHKDNGIPKIVETRLSYSKKGVLRGLHGDNRTGKLFFPISGVFQFFAIGVEDKSDRIFYSVFNEDFQTAIYVPPGYLNGHKCLTDNCVMLYMWTEYYNGPESQYTVNAFDEDLNIDWDTSIIPIQSDRDKNGMSFKKIKEQYENKVW